MSAGRPRTRRRLPAWTTTLHGKFAAFVIVMCCVLATGVGVLVHVLVGRQAESQARSAALSQLDSVATAYAAGEPLGRDAAVNPADLPAPLRAMALRGERGTQLADHQGRPAMWAVTPADGKALAVHLDYSRRAAAIRGLDRTIVGSSAFAIALTLAVGLFGVSRITRRLHHTAQVARRISTGDLDARVDDPRVLCAPFAQDETAAVAAAVDAMAATLQTKLHSEQCFTADVAHELRTPLTGLQIAAELLPPPGRPAELVRDRIRTMSRLTQDLLEISRLDAEVEQADIEVHQLGPPAERAVLATGLQAEVRTERDTRVETDQRRLQRVLGSLVSNAHGHGRPPVLLTVDGRVITVRDHGDGYPGHLLDHGPQRFRSRSGSGRKTGHGLGLTIAMGQARVLGATLRFSNAPDGGAVAELVLPPSVPGPRRSPSTRTGSS